MYHNQDSYSVTTKVTNPTLEVSVEAGADGFKFKAKASDDKWAGIVKEMYDSLKDKITIIEIKRSPEEDY